MFALVKPCTPLPAQGRSGTASVRRLASVAQDREFAQRGARGKPIIRTVDSLSARSIANLETHFWKIVSTFDDSQQITVYNTSIFDGFDFCCANQGDIEVKIFENTRMMDVDH
jgi:hypothetical protein